MNPNPAISTGLPEESSPAQDDLIPPVLGSPDYWNTSTVGDADGVGGSQFATPARQTLSTSNLPRSSNTNAWSQLQNFVPQTSESHWRIPEQNEYFVARAIPVDYHAPNVFNYNNGQPFNPYMKLSNAPFSLQFETPAVAQQLPLTIESNEHESVSYGASFAHSMNSYAYPPRNHYGTAITFETNGPAFSASVPHQPHDQVQGIQYPPNFSLDIVESVTVSSSTGFVSTNRGPQLITSSERNGGSSVLTDANGQRDARQQGATVNTSTWNVQQPEPTTQSLPQRQNPPVASREAQAAMKTESVTRSIARSSTSSANRNSNRSTRNRAHINRDNTKSAQCNICKRTFARKYDCNRHELGHDPKNRFACECGATFSRQDSRRRHQKSYLHTHP